MFLIEWNDEDMIYGPYTTHELALRDIQRDHRHGSEMSIRPIYNQKKLIVDQKKIQRTRRYYDGGRVIVTHRFGQENNKVYFGLFCDWAYAEAWAEDWASRHNYQYELDADSLYSFEEHLEDTVEDAPYYDNDD